MADAAKPKKRLPFKPTALRQKSNPKPVSKSDDEDNDDGSNLFNRGASVFEQELQEQERRMKRKQTEREKISQVSTVGNGRNSPSRTSRDQIKTGNFEDDDEDAREPGTPPSKRSRTSDDSPESRIRHSPSKRDDAETPSKRMTRAAASRTPRKQEPLPSKPVISIDDSDDDDDEDDIYDASPIRQPRRQSSQRDPSPLVIDDDDDDPFEVKNNAGAEEEEDDDDDDMAEYVRQAKARKEAMEKQAKEREAETTETVNIFVTSEIPGAGQRQFRFTLSKPLKVLRSAWIDVHKGRVDLPPEELSGVFLAWRRHRLYDLTTLRSLDLPGEYRKCTGDYDGFKDGWTNVHLQMWTQELWDENERRVARQRRHDLGEFSDDEGEGGGGGGSDAAAEAEQEEQKIKVLLKTKTDEPLKTSVRPSTTIGTLMELFRKMRGLAPDAPITLMFDGDELEESQTVEEADIGDMETIEVYLK
ncbi:uncharacterized protein CTRU02_208735 [Colletotrichum truncatum]|uniref:Uncharacterized protein n=1 Tax=Colletotrichum truncatum TaxID=5467 RepID=A0ACC3YX48_COLTU|nr:uncharacterized protein CTRU02_06608 [Colletotrichum truncatum]KAF6792525.1 hypothetical protein CTRU02_06608 [Colletotrichum truncatum]